MNAIPAMTEITTPTPHEGLDAAWQRATKREVQRLPLIMLLAGAFMFVIFLTDTTTWPLQIDTTHWVGAAIGASVFFALLLAFSIRQTTTSAERYVSLLSGLESDERRIARADLSAARPASDPVLREIEIARARQLALFGPSSLGAACAPAAFQALAVAVMFASDSPGLGGLFGLSALVNGWSAWKRYRDTRNARRFLDTLALPHR